MTGRVSGTLVLYRLPDDTVAARLSGSEAMGFGNSEAEAEGGLSRALDRPLTFDCIVRLLIPEGREWMARR